MTDSKFFIKEPNQDNNTVELWSSIRLPFEPKGYMLEMRKSIRAAVKRMRYVQDTMLHALYVSEADGFCDVENVLLYNVGTGSFAHLSHRGICFERLYAKPRQPLDNTDNKFPYYHCYSLIPLHKGLLHWDKERVLARFNSVLCPAVRSDSKPHSYWYSIKKASIDIIGKIDLPSNYGVDIKINAPKNKVINLASVIKPLLDGIICAFHSHDGTNNSLVIGRLAALLGERESIIESLLMDQSTAILGIRNLLHPLGKGIQWNPADDFCIAVKILLDDSIEDSTWSIDGEIFTIQPAQFSGYLVK